MCYEKTLEEKVEELKTTDLDVLEEVTEELGRIWDPINEDGDGIEEEDYSGDESYISYLSTVEREVKRVYDKLEDDMPEFYENQIDDLKDTIKNNEEYYHEKSEFLEELSNKIGMFSDEMSLDIEVFRQKIDYINKTGDYAPNR